jgi:DNA-binding NarL/FixJ family response regulator
MAMDAEAMLTGSRLLDVLVVSAVRFLRESLAEILGQVPGLRICGQASGVEEALAGLAARPDVVLLDVGIPGGVAAAARLRDAAQGARIIALGVGETAENVLAWAEAGVAGYVPDTASVAELVSLIRQISEGEQPCPSGIVARLLLRIGAAGRLAAAAEAPLLTGREMEIYRLIGAGLSNKDIARRLSISLGTTKTHVHNLLAKLSLHRRGEVTARTRL